MSVTPKFRANSGPQGDGRYVWGGHPDGFPFIGMPGVPPTNEELMGAECVYTPGYRLFKLPEQTEDYLKVIDLIANGRYKPLHELKIPKPDDPSVLYCHVFWVDVAMVPGTIPGISR